MDITILSLRQLNELLHQKQISSSEIVDAYLEKASSDNHSLGAFIFLEDKKNLLIKAKESEKRWSKNKPKSCIDGIPIAIKDNIHVINMPTTCGSHILQNYIPPFEATAIQNIQANGGIVMGKTNLDEFGMGATTETSFLPARNPIDHQKTPGGSSGGSAIAIRSNMCPLALGSDTGGSVRQPASFCGIVGFKPTYGAISRYGLVAHASSLDQIGTMAQDVDGVESLFKIIRGFDPKDATTLKKMLLSFSPLQNLRAKKIAVLKPEVHSNIAKIFQATVKNIEQLGAKLDEIDAFSSIIPTYYLIATAEASSNLGRYDGVKYGMRKQENSYQQMLKNTRSHGFGKEVKKRILLGNFVLSHGHRDAYYSKAQKVRMHIQQRLAQIFEQYDAIITVTTPTSAFDLGETDFMKMYNADALTAIANLAGIPAISIPCGTENGMPIGLQIMGKWSHDEEVLRIARCIEQNISQINISTQDISTLSKPKKYKDICIDIENIIELSQIDVTDVEKKILQQEINTFLLYAKNIDTPQLTSQTKMPKMPLISDVVEQWEDQIALQKNAPAVKENSYIVPPQKKLKIKETTKKILSKATWDVVIGLEVHAQLNTKSKLFCRCSTEFGKTPNQNTCPVCTGQPGTLPALNEQAVNMAITAGLAMNAMIQKTSYFARKNYFYPDCPKSYQISQFDLPICTGGSLAIDVSGEIKHIRLNRIHIEEDAGKMVHSVQQQYSSVDFNRSSIPLIEIVSEPDIKTAQEAKAYITMLRALLVSLGICDGSMEKGSLRCDVNVSLKPKEQQELGTKVEVKNVNSFKAVERSIEYEIKRQQTRLNEGQKIRQQTRLWDENKQQTILMRMKENAADYRYFSEPDLPPLIITQKQIDSLQKTLPLTPLERRKKYQKLDQKQATYLMYNPHHATYIDSVVNKFPYLKEVANWFFGEFLSYTNAHVSIHITAQDFAFFLECVQKKEINHTIGKDVIKKAFLAQKELMEIINSENLKQIEDTSFIAEIVKQVLQENQKQVDMYHNGKTQIMGYLMGQVMRNTKGKANPQIVNQLLRENLE